MAFIINQKETDEKPKPSSVEITQKERPVVAKQESEFSEMLETFGAPKETESSAGEEKINEPVATAAQPAIPLPKNPNLTLIENILSDNLKEAFLSLTPNEREGFKQEGERVAKIIWQMIETAKIQVQKIIDLLTSWLKRIPGLNKYFIEQESKLKTDKIIMLAKKHGTK